MSYKLHSTAQPFLDLVRSHHEPYIVEILGTEIIVHPNVMSPKYDWSSTFIGKNLPDLTDMDVLDVGSGSGVLSVLAERKGARSVLAVDINPDAVASTQDNFEKYGLDAQLFVARESDLFSAVSPDAKFDYVIFNAPFHGTQAHDDLEKSIADFQYHLSNRFFTEVAQYLKPNGKVLYAFGSMGDLDQVRSFWEENGFKVEKEAEDHQINYIEQAEDWICYLFTLVRVN